MYKARIFSDKLPDAVALPLKQFSGNDCYLIKREINKKSPLSNKNNCHINVKGYIEKFGGEMLNGWLLYRDQNWTHNMGIWVWQYHSVWIKTNGEIVDITESERYKNLPLSTFFPDTTHKLDLINGISYNNIAIFENIKITNKLEKIIQNQARQLYPKEIYWTTNCLNHFRALNEHSGQYRYTTNNYDANLKLLKEKYGCFIQDKKLVSVDPSKNQVTTDIFFDFNLSIS